MQNYVVGEGTKSYTLATFFILAFGFSWVIEIPLALEARGVIAAPIPFSFHYLAAFGPLLAALIVTWLHAGDAGVRELLGRMFKWRVHVGWWLVAAGPLWIFLLLIAIQIFGMGARPDLRDLGQLDFLPHQGTGALLWWIVTFGLGEETGWRGFALPNLQNGRSALRATIILWFFWALWHLPLFFYQYDTVALPGFLISLLAGAITLTWLYNSSRGSILLAAIWHGTFNYVTACVNCKYGLSPMVMSIAVMILAVVIVVLYRPATLSAHEKQIGG
ncbi:MAG: CPBP family intramembrane glutamic endopeptidase [Candidatus Promineifilaceae bacterium]|nr:CPBP family intramembrane glutamic endopeptidase [Candidatus Promineifilaceae bacterium]